MLQTTLAVSTPRGLFLRSVFCAVLVVVASSFAVSTVEARQAKNADAPQRAKRSGGAPSARDVVPPNVLLQIVRAEDERRWAESELARLLESESAGVRARAALAAGRIGDAGAVEPLSALMRRERNESVRAMAAFALGEIEAEAGAGALLEALRMTKVPLVRARAVEALGKIAAALPDAQAARREEIGKAILGALVSEQRAAKPNRALVVLAITAAMRARAEGAPRTIALFLDSKDARVRADAANSLTRLRAKESLERLRAMLAKDEDPVARANAARALGAAEDASALDALVARAATDPDERVRVSAIRSVAQLKNARAAEPLIKRGDELLETFKRRAGGSEKIERPSELNELYEVATALGRILQNTGHEKALDLLRRVREAGAVAPEVETALARIAPVEYLRDKRVVGGLELPEGANAATWRARTISAVGLGLGEFAALTSEALGNSAASLQADAQIKLRSLLNDKATPAISAPDLLRALASFKPPDLGAIAREKLKADDVIVRATSADILGELPPDDENRRALVAALPRALRDEMNDAALSILNALARERGEDAAAAIKSALEVSDYLVRRRASDILRARGAAAASSADDGSGVETVNTRNRPADYQRALARIGREVRAVVKTDKGAFTIELLPEAAPLNVDNFVQLARKNYFDDITFHRVVPNFVIQGGDPRGDGNGGPGYQIRCEINTVPYERGAVGMALSGKDTGGSQWFVTHSPQPHLDGGYTVFGRVVDGMEVVDRIARGDRIRDVEIIERDARPSRRRR